MALRLLILSLLLWLSAGAAEFTNSTSLALQTSLTNSGVMAAGDTIWLRSGTYTPPYTNSDSMNAPQWSVTVSGSVGSLITLRSYPGEWAKIDRQWRFGSSHYLRFRDLEFYDSFKGNNPTNASYPNGPWLHFDGSLADSSGNEWINCVIHDVNNCWSGGTSGNSVRGCIIWHVGLNEFDHISYPAPDEFIGNISGWHSCDGINLQTRSFLARSNIMFGAGQPQGGQVDGDFRVGPYPHELSYNYIYNRYTSDKIYDSIKSSGGATINSNVIVSSQVAAFNSTTNVTIKGNTFQMASPFAAYPIFHRYATAGSWAIDFNHYTAQSPQSVRLEDPATSYTFSEWRSEYSLFDAASTATNSAMPPDAVFVIPNQDEAKRAHIAVYNFTSNNTVSLDLSGVLNAGDTYRLFSAQNYGAGPIQTGTFNGTSLAVPMTNLTTAPILYGSNWGLVQPPATSPEFAAFILLGQAAGVTVTVQNLYIGRTP